MSTITSNATGSPDDVQPAEPETLVLGIRISVIVRIIALAAGFTLLFWPNFRRLWEKTNPFDGDPNWQHGPFVPLIGLYYLYINREKLAAARQRTIDYSLGELIVGAIVALPLTPVFSAIPAVAWFGVTLGGALIVAVMGTVVALSASWQRPKHAARRRWLGVICAMAFFEGGILLFTYGIWPGQNDFFKDLGLVCTLFGATAILCGWEVMKIAWFPIVFLICALPWPGLFYGKIAGPLQKLAAKVAVHALNFLGVTAGQFGTKIFVRAIDHTTHTLNVAEACSGLRSLMTFFAIAAALAFLSNRPLWEKIIVVLSALPIAIFCNMMRVTGQGLLDGYVSTHWSESFAHSFVGLVMMIPAFFMILLVSWILQNIFVEVADDKHALRAAANAARPARRMGATPVPASRGPAPAAAAPEATARPAAARRMTPGAARAAGLTSAPSVKPRPEDKQ